MRKLFLFILCFLCNFAYAIRFNNNGSLTLDDDRHFTFRNNRWRHNNVVIQGGVFQNIIREAVGQFGFRGIVDIITEQNIANDNDNFLFDMARRLTNVYDNDHHDHYTYVINARENYGIFFRNEREQGFPPIDVCLGVLYYLFLENPDVLFNEINFNGTIFSIYLIYDYPIGTSSLDGALSYTIKFIFDFREEMRLISMYPVS